MAGLKLNIGRSKSKQIAPQNNSKDGNTRSNSPRSSDTKKKLLSCDFKKAMFRSSRQDGQGSKSRASPRYPQEDSDTHVTHRSEYSDFTIENGLFTDCEDPRCGTKSSSRPNSKELDDINESPPERLPSQHRNSSWICSTWDGGSFCSEESEDELDDSLYQLLDSPNDNSDQFKKLSLHNILVEEELSFQRSLVWNDA
jgi:hypothetical protein